MPLLLLLLVWRRADGLVLVQRLQQLGKQRLELDQDANSVAAQLATQVQHQVRPSSSSLREESPPAASRCLAALLRALHVLSCAAVRRASAAGAHSAATCCTCLRVLFT